MSSTSMLRVGLGIVSIAVLANPQMALAWKDQNQNRIDDIIETVHTQGWASAFQGNDPAGRMLIGVQPGPPIVYAVYVKYDHHPTALDQALLSTSGVTLVWPFQYIDYIESRATFAQIQSIAGLAGVTRIESVPVLYATNHYGARAVRSRDSRGLSKLEDYVLFPSVQQDLGYDGTGVVIAILDTGVNDDIDQVNPSYPGAEGLQGKFLGGGEFWSGEPALNTPLNGSSNPQDHGAAASSYHGTHVAGSALGTGGTGGFFAGVAPGARLVDCKVLSDAGASVGGAARGLEWCIANRNTIWSGLLPGSIWQGIDVINMSLGSPTSNSDGNDATCELVNQAVDAGMVVCIASGNDSQAPGIATPSAADKSISVGASLTARTLRRDDDRVTDFSNEGPRLDDGDADHRDEMKPNVVAPGAGILSADGDFLSDGSSYQQLSGTSMACPHVAGCAALLLEAVPSLTPLQLRTILENTAEHNIPTVKASGDRGQDPFGVDANYDPSSGWGLVDMYAALKEALDSTSGVQVTQIRPIVRAGDGAIDLTWITQREHPFTGFYVLRAPDVNGVPGAFVQLNATPIAPSAAGDANLAGDDNRTPYLYTDSGPGLVLGNKYWYRIEWVDLTSTRHGEPPVPAEFGLLPRVATIYYSIAHNAPDNDLFIRTGSDQDYDPGPNVGGADFERLGPPEVAQDSAVVLLNIPAPLSTGTSTIGTIDHFWSLGLTVADNVTQYLPPSIVHPWFLKVTDGGYVNRTGRVTSFSMFVNDSPGSASGTTYITNHVPMPQPTGEGGLAPALLWIPEQGSVSIGAYLEAKSEPGGVRLSLELAASRPGSWARVYRSLSDVFETRLALTGALPIADRDFVYVDMSGEPGVAYQYWVEVGDAEGSVFHGPVGAAAGFATIVRLRQNPISRSGRIAYVVGPEASPSGEPVDLCIRVHDVRGRLVRELLRGQVRPHSSEIDWDARDAAGRRVPAGVYYVSFRAGTVERAAKVTVVR